MPQLLQVSMLVRKKTDIHNCICCANIVRKKLFSTVSVKQNSHLGSLNDYQKSQVSLIILSTNMKRSVKGCSVSSQYRLLC